MFLPLRSGRRDLGRSARARLHRDTTARRRFGTQRHTLLAGAARRQCEPQRRTHAVADRERAVAAQRTRSESAGTADVGCRAVPRTRDAARPLEPHT